MVHTPMVPTGATRETQEKHTPAKVHLKGSEFNSLPFLMRCMKRRFTAENVSGMNNPSAKHNLRNHKLYPIWEMRGDRNVCDAGGYENTPRNPGYA